MPTPLHPIERLRAVAQRRRSAAGFPERERRLLAHFAAGQYDAAESLARELIALDPDAMFGWKALGSILTKAERYRPALDAFQQAIARDATDPECLLNFGHALHALGRSTEALACFTRALELKPDYAEAYNHRGILLGELGQLQDAIADFHQALRLAPGHAEAYNNLGIVLDEDGRLHDALDCYRRALELKPDYAGAWINLGNAMQDLGRIAEAVESYDRALALCPDLAVAAQNRLFCLNDLPFLTREEVFAAHVDFERRHAARIARLPPAAAPQTGSRITDPLRLGLISADFRQHSVAYFLLPFLERIDRGRFRIQCYSRGRRQDWMTAIFKRLADSWVECVGWTMPELAQRIRDDGIDILVDLSGHTVGNALLAFAARPAPVQIAWLGYPNTTGLSSIAYRIVDDITDPPGDADRFHTERLIRLPTGFLCYRPQCAPGDALPPPVPSRLAGPLTFGSFNYLGKISSITLDLWARLLRDRPDARLLLKSSAAIESRAWDRIRDAFAARGVAPERVEVLERVPGYPDHLRRYHRVHLALDTFPYHGTTTTCEALWMSVPVVTLAGDRHASRVGASLLTRVGLPELVATTPEDYVRIALDLAGHPERLAQLRAGLRERMEDSPLRDEVGFSRQMGAALWDIWRDAVYSRS